MSTTTISGFDIGPVQINGSHSHVIVKKGATLMIGGSVGGTTGAIMEDLNNPVNCHDNDYTIDGRVLGYQIGMYLSGANDAIDIGEFGELHALYGLVTTGTNDHINNDGKIIGDAISPGSGFGVYAMGTGSLFIDNGGMIMGDTAIGFQGSKLSLTNEKDGRIIGNTVGIVAISPADGTAEIINHGYIAGKSGTAFVSAGNDATIINDGRIKGQIIFGDGDDLLDNRGGALSNLTVIGGGGGDTLIVDDNKHFLQEMAAGGTDTIKSTVTYKLPAEVERLMLIGNSNIDGKGSTGANTLKGNGGNNVLAGLGGADDLFGGKGTDKLIGGAGADVFHFATGDGHDKVQDFHHMEDKIDLGDWAGVQSFNKVLADAHNQGADVLIEHGNDSLLLVGVHKGDLTAGDFSF
jgi:Ca2+-binding RTX toxin-like protein